MFHECVIIPDFGGFISNYQPAQYDETNHSFSPPSKEVVFNAKIKKGDGVLLNYIVEKENLSYREARILIDQYVDQLYMQLNRGEILDFPGLGNLSYTKAGSLVFQPTDMVRLIEAYGLNSIPFDSFGTKERKKHANRRVMIDIQDPKNIVRIAAGFGLFLTLSLFPLRKERSVFLSSNLNPIAAFDFVSDSAGGLWQEQTKDPVNETPAEEKKAPYILVGGSFEQLENAEIYKNALCSQGYPAEVLSVNDRFYRVSIESFFNWDEAIRSMQQHREKDPESQVWVSTR